MKYDIEMHIYRKNRYKSAEFPCVSVDPFAGGWIQLLKDSLLLLLRPAAQAPGLAGSEVQRLSQKNRRVGLKSY